MQLGRLVGAVGLVALLSTGVMASACGSPQPPPLPDYDGSTDGTLKDVFVPPCSSPAPGCPCSDAGIQEICGTVYHYSGSYITCSKEYVTCQSDGTWSACVGPNVFGAD